MTIENAAVRAETKRLEAEYEVGIEDGYSADPNILPEYFYKPYIHLTARQRGFVFGRELRLQELKEETKSVTQG